MENYLSILAESLQKKIVVLKQIEGINHKQLTLIQSEDMSLESYDAYVDEKDECITALNKLDEGFELLYQNIAKELQQNRAKYTEQIKQLQALIKEVTDLSVSVQAQEARNKDAVTKYFAQQRQGIRSSRLSSKAALGYYQNMNNSQVVEAQFMDQKK